MQPKQFNLKIIMWPKLVGLALLTGKKSDQHSTGSPAFPVFICKYITAKELCF